MIDDRERVCIRSALMWADKNNVLMIYVHDMKDKNAKIFSFAYDMICLYASHSWNISNNHMLLVLQSAEL